MPPCRRAVRLSAQLAVVTLVGVAASACSNQQAPVNRGPHEGSATASLVAGVQQVLVQAGDTFRFAPSTITVHPGTVRIVLANVGQGAPHNWTLASLGVGTPLTAAGRSAAVTFTAPAPGTYTYVCTIHEKQGQTGTLVVLAR